MVVKKSAHMSYTAAPSPKGTNYERLYLTSQRPRMAHDAAPQAFRAGQDRRRGGRDRRPFGRDDDPFSDALNQLQDLLQDVISDPADLTQANELVSRLLEAMPSGGEDDAPNDPEAQRKDPNLFLQDRRKATDGKLSDRDWKTYDDLCKARDADNDPQRNRMAGDQRPPAGKLAGILAAKTR
jgi:hypothetical protein